MRWRVYEFMCKALISSKGFLFLGMSASQNEAQSILLGNKNCVVL